MIGKISQSVLIGGMALKGIENILSKKEVSSVFILVDSNTRKFCLPVLLNESNYFKNATSHWRSRSFTTARTFFPPFQFVQSIGRRLRALAGVAPRHPPAINL